MKKITNEKDGSILVEIPSGEFEMGDGEDDDCPKHNVCLDTYYIGVHTVTNRQYKKFVDETGHRPPDIAEWGYPIWKDGNYPEKYANHPVVCISWEDAMSYCEWAGLSLPTEAQWEKAARGSQEYKYPWGNDWNSSKCLNYMNKGLEETCPIDSYPEGVSGYGLYNTSGNVLEWCHDWYDEDYYKSSQYQNPKGPSDGSYRVVRGGSWGSGISDCRCACRNDFNLPSERANFRGFRVALA